MGKTGKWLRNFIAGKKEKEKAPSNHNYSTTTPVSTPQTTLKEKRRWSFRRSPATSASTKDSNSKEPIVTPPPIVPIKFDLENEKKTDSVDLATVAPVIRPSEAANGKAHTIEEAAAIKIQSVFRSYLARKALRALKGLVKLQALVRGHLVRKQATATLRCMQALMTAQSRARAQRIRMVEDHTKPPLNQRQSVHRKSIKDIRFGPENHDIDRGVEENIKIVEVDLGNYNSHLNGNIYLNPRQLKHQDHRISAHYPSDQTYLNHENYQVSPSPSALTEMSPRACSGHFEDYSYNTAQSTPQYYSSVSKSDHTESMSYDYQLHPNYMANTESSRAKSRSQSAPKMRPESFERQPSRRRASMEGRNIPRAMRMQRSTSHVGSDQNYQYTCPIKLDRSAVSLVDSECGSTSTVLTNTNYCRSLVAYDIHGNRY